MWRENYYSDQILNNQFSNFLLLFEGQELQYLVRNYRKLARFIGEMNDLSWFALSE